MHRSSSTSRAAEEFFAHLSSPLSSSKGSQGGRTSENSELPTYDPLSEAAKKEKSRIKFAENAIHVIPVVLVLCAIILWFFSNPVDMVHKDDSILARIKGLTIDGNIDNGNGQTGLPNTLEVEDLDPARMSDPKTGMFAGRESE
ncbi:uncharacterized protein LOC122659020 isoform X2 [Telopea speciosissima]|uniref:uncharacterized protein LOC122659020 isoform X2 n=1 Tax=Telopea speciosissima TaxID=54955 RepID=UPI001CC64D53|nr:uncharacterized protein LOC122659020 isoform X2 [Telopea speciosissima]